MHEAYHMLHLKLKKIRKEKGLTQRELHEITGLSIAQISQMENGNKKLLQPSFEKVLKALQTSVEEFFSSSSSSKKSLHK
jgi:transcriptional regulator with XRE-family HTH domain